MSKKSKIFSAGVGIILSAIGVNNISNSESPIISKQNIQISNSIENSFRTHKFRQPIFEPTEDDLKKLERNNNLQLKNIIHRLEDIGLKIPQDRNVNLEDISFLEEYIKTFQNKNVKELKWYEKNAMFFLSKIKLKETNLKLKYLATKFIKYNLNLIDVNLLLNNVRNKKSIKIQGKIISIDFSSINENLAVNVFRQSHKYKKNLKLVYTILLIENNFGKIKESSVGAQGISQIMPSYLRKVYGNKKLTDWDKFVAIYSYLDEIEKELNINISNPNKIDPEDFILALAGYFDGVTNMHKNPENIFTTKDVGFTYLLKGIISIFKIKFEIPTEFEKQKDNRFETINTKLI